jgi:hypothetical protein
MVAASGVFLPETISDHEKIIFRMLASLVDQRV